MGIPTLVIAHYITLDGLGRFDDRGMPVIYYVVSYNLYVMHPWIFHQFQRMMQVAGMEISLFGENNA